jgi:hypothetical protein
MSILRLLSTEWRRLPVLLPPLPPSLLPLPPAAHVGLPEFLRKIPHCGLWATRWLCEFTHYRTPIEESISRPSRRQFIPAVFPPSQHTLSRSELIHQCFVHDFQINKIALNSKSDALLSSHGDLCAHLALGLINQP